MNRLLVILFFYVSVMANAVARNACCQNYSAENDVSMSGIVASDTLQIPVDDVIVTDTVAKEEQTIEELMTQESAKMMGKVKRDWTKWRPDIKKAMWLAIIFPGGGQIYNHKYWKLPIIYGGFLGCIYAWRWNGQMYSDYSQAYLDIMDDDPSTRSYEQFLHLGIKIDESNISRYQDLFRRRKDRFRRYRDLSIFCMIGVYALSVIDAYVDASLSEFDISDDLSMRISPAVFNGGSVSASNNPFRSSAMGVSCSLTF